MDFEDRKRRYISVFEQGEHPASSYLKDHASRFIRTRDLVFSGRGTAQGLAILDIASHWLHNAFLYAEEGAEVIALDLQGGEISHPAVIEFAQAHDIALLPCKALNNPVELESLPDDFFDLVMFSETIEHVTFNPIRLWSLVYKKMKVGGRIIITTPNYFFYGGALRNDIRNILRGLSPGISIYDLIHRPDYAPHWKEFSKRDLQSYFSHLSPDFSVSKVLYSTLYGRESRYRVLRLGRRLFPALFHNGLYTEVVLTEKRAGVTAMAHW